MIPLPKGFVPDSQPPPAARSGMPEGFVPDKPTGPKWLAEENAELASRVPTEGLPKWADYVRQHRKDKGALNAFGENVIQGMTFGFGDELAGLAEVGSNPGGASFLEKYKLGRDRARETLHEASEGHPIASLAGNVAGAAVTAPLALPLKAAQGAGLGARFAVNAAQGAFSGALAGAGASEAEDLKGVVQDAAKGGLVGGALAGGTAVGGKLLWDKLVGGAQGRINGRIVQDITGGRATTAGKRIYQNEDLVIDTANKFRLGPRADDPAALAAATTAARKEAGAKIGQAFETMGEESLGARVKDIVKAVKGVKRDYSAPSEAGIQRTIDRYLEDLGERWTGKRVGLQDLNTEIGNLEKVGFKGAELSDAAGASLKRDLASSLEDVLQERLNEIKDLGGKIAGSSLGKREAFAGLSKSASAAQGLAELNRDYRGLKLIESMAKERAGLPPASRAAGGLRNAVGNAVDMGLLFTHPVAYGAKKLGEVALPAAARGADQALAGLYSAAQAGKLSAQMLRDAMEAGVPRGLIEQFAGMVGSQPATAQP